MLDGNLWLFLIHPGCNFVGGHMLSREKRIDRASEDNLSFAKLGACETFCF